MNYDKGRVYSVPVLSAAGTSRSGFSTSSNSNTNLTNTATIAQLAAFLANFRISESFIYRDRLRANILRKEWTLEVEMAHLIGWDEGLAARCRSEPGEIIPLVRLPSLIAVATSY